MEEAHVLTEAAAEAFAHEWVEAWNAHDLERILSHWADDCVFSSPFAAQVTGHATIHGRAALSSYWSAGLARSPDLHFDLHTVFLGADSLVLGYRNHRGQDVAEMIQLGEDGLAVRGAAHYSPAAP